MRRVVVLGLVACAVLCGVSASGAEEAAEPTAVFRPPTDEAGRQIRRVVLAQLKALAPENAAPRVGVEAGRALDATVDGERYRGAAYRQFSVLWAGADEMAALTFCVRTMAPWKLGSGIGVLAGV